MLQNMRERTQGIIAVAIVALLSLTFALWGVQNYLQSRGGDNVVAKINGVKITRSQFQNIYNRTKQRLMLQMGKDFSLDQQTQAKLKQQVLQQLIQSEAIYQAAQKAGLQISPEQIDAVLTHLPAFQKGGHFSASKFQQVLSAMLFSEAEFVNNMQRDMTLEQLQTGVITSAFILPDEIDNIVKLVQQTRDIGYVIIPDTKFVRSMQVSTQDIQNYYQQNQQQYQTPEKVSISYIELSAANLKNKVQVNTQEMQQYYNDNLDIYSHPARWYVARIFVPAPENAAGGAVKQAQKKITALNQQVKAGEGFVKVDSTYGKPVWLVQGELPPAFVNNLKQLKPGQISAPFRTPNGFYVVKLLQYKPAQVLLFNQVQSQVKKALIQQKTTQLFDQENDKLADLTYTNSNSLASAAKQFGLAIQTTGLFTQQIGKTGILANPKIIKAAFSPTVLQQNYNSDVIAIAPDKVIVLRVKQHIAAATQPLVQVKPAIVQTLKMQVAGQKAQALGQQMLQEMQQGKSPRTLAAQNHLNWQTVAKLKPQTKAVKKPIIAAAFGLPVPQEGKPAVAGTALDNGYAVVQVTKIYPGDVKQMTKKQRQVVARKLELAMGQTDYDTYANAAVKKSKIKIFVKNEQ